MQNEKESNKLSVTGLGMATSISRDVISSCAAQRCGISRTVEYEYHEVWNPEEEEVEPLVVHMLDGITEGFEGSGKWIELASLAFEDLLRYSLLKDMDPEFWLKTGFIVNFPLLDESRFPNEESTAGQIPQNLLSDFNIPITTQNVISIFKGHTGIGHAIKIASEKIYMDVWDQTIIMGVDSYVDYCSLNWIDNNGRLKTPENSNGFIPGEAAACFMVEHKEKAKKRMALEQGYIGATQIGQEEKNETDKYFSSKELAISILRTLQANSNEACNIYSIYVDLMVKPSKRKQWQKPL